LCLSNVNADSRKPTVGPERETNQNGGGGKKRSGAPLVLSPEIEKWERVSKGTQERVGKDLKNLLVEVEHWRGAERGGRAAVKERAQS